MQASGRSVHRHESGMTISSKQTIFAMHDIGRNASARLAAGALPARSRRTAAKPAPSTFAWTVQSQPDRRRRRWWLQRDVHLVPSRKLTKERRFIRAA
jgi:hypothetical protein